MRCLFGAVVLTPFAAAAQACAPEPGAAQLESARYVAVVRTTPEKVPVGQHFSLQVSICPKMGRPAPESVVVDAHMPEHRHGMNYKASVTRSPGNRYSASGLMFHMPGRWEFIIDVRSDGSTDRLTRSVVAE